jgi:hypothetical protein
MFELLIKLRYQWYIHPCSKNDLGNILLLFSLSFRFLLCEASGRYVWGSPDGYPERPDVYSGCSDYMGSSSKCFWLSSGRSCFRNRLRGTTSERYLCSIRTVNPVWLNPFLPAPQLSWWASFG